MEGFRRQVAGLEAAASDRGAEAENRRREEAGKREAEAKRREEEKKTRELYERKIASTGEQLETLRKNYDKLQKKLKREAAAAKETAKTVAAAAAAAKEAKNEDDDKQLKESVKEMAKILKQADEYRSEMEGNAAKFSEARTFVCVCFVVRFRHTVPRMC